MNYLSIYNNLIRKAKARVDLKIPHHKHHVIPRWMGGTDDADNLVVLSLKEHFFAHVLLAKAIGCKDSWAAVKIMGEGFSFRSSRHYETALKKFSENNPAKSETHRKRLSELRKVDNPMFNEKNVEKMRVSQKLRYETNPDLREAVSGDKSPTRRPEVRAKMAESARKRFSRPEERTLASIRTKKYFQNKEI